MDVVEGGTSAPPRAPDAAAERVVPLAAPGLATAPATERAVLDRAVAELSEHARAFARTPPAEKAKVLAETLPRLLEGAEAMVERACHHKGLDPASSASGEEWLAGPFATIQGTRLLVEALLDIADFGRPLLPRGAIRARDDGRIEVRVVPQRGLDALLSSGMTADVRMLPGTTRDDVTAMQARFYQEKEPEGGVSLVLGAGNVASIPPLDALHRLFVEGRVVLLKMSPVNAYLAPHLEKALAPLVDRGWLRIVHGGAEEGAYLASHPGISDVHVTGSAATHDAIVWGPPGPERDRRKLEGAPVLTKPITSELGNVSPVLVAPWLYDKRELWWIARAVASQVSNNASFNCNAAKMIVLARSWPQRALFLELLEKALSSIPPRRAYYPGAAERHARLSTVHRGEQVIHVGKPQEGELPWTLVVGLDPHDPTDPRWSNEPFCSMVSEVSIGGPDVVEFFAAATELCNTRLWGTLSCAIYAHDLLAEDPTTSEAIERAIDELAYGAIAVNQWPGVIYGLGVTPWGGHPRATLADVQSGIGFVHNTAMLERVEKVILRAPLRTFPKPPYFFDHRRAHVLGRRLSAYASDPSLGKVLSLVGPMLLG